MKMAIVCIILVSCLVLVQPFHAFASVSEKTLTQEVTADQNGNFAWSDVIFNSCPPDKTTDTLTDFYFPYVNVNTDNEKIQGGSPGTPIPCNTSIAVTITGHLKDPSRVGSLAYSWYTKNSPIYQKRLTILDYVPVPEFPINLSIISVLGFVAGFVILKHSRNIMKL